MSSTVPHQPVDPAALSSEPRPAQPLSPSPARLPRGYVAAWVAAAALSGTYLTGTALTGTSLVGAESTQQNVASQDETARAVEIAEARAMKYKVSLEDFQRDVALLRTEFTGRSGDTTLVARLAALEERLSIETGVAIAKFSPTATQNSPAAFAAAFEHSNGAVTIPSPATRVAGAVASVGPDGLPRVSIPLETGSLQKSPQSQAQPQAQAQAQLPVPNKAGLNAISPDAPTTRVGTASPAGAVVINAQPAAPAAAPAGSSITTAQPVAVAAVPPAPPPKPFAVQLASGGSVESLRLSWSVLSEQHGDTLRSLEPRVTKSAGAPGASPIFDLLAGPFKTAADARKACKALATRGVDCKIGNFGGQSL